MKRCVLVVEDDPFIRMDTVHTIETAGFEVIEAACADEALVKLGANSSIEIMITDIEMPGSMDGVGLAFAVRARWPPIQIIVVSGKVRPDDSELPEQARFIAKPFRSTQIVEALYAAT